LLLEEEEQDGSNVIKNKAISIKSFFNRNTFYHDI